ncbi:hypothetical protein BJ973_002673 [Actinoplanes tereljensis]|uniref:Uncharacterized protein n=1 Tax=Paractinoplanes tereljensis TaxID=571912 RepID=A0A919NQE3_9ACTN|nr:hypothetical protein [Actinoplanes tereljensis]GIF22350.1 hypothetical protein Ate02nite_50800 [Actinoplanes tereljensis]
MGAKTALLAFADKDLPTALREAGRPQPALLTGGGVEPGAGEAEAVVRRLSPGYQVTPIRGGTLLEDCFPPDDVAFAVVLPGAVLLCDRRLVAETPPELPEQVLAEAAGRRILWHSMHSVIDALTFAVWEDGQLIRSLSVSPDTGVVEDVGEPLPFERPYWAGEHPVTSLFPGQGPYPLPFHPLDLGEAALRALFGFVIEGRSEPDDVDADTISLHGFSVADPTGREQQERDAIMREVMSRMAPPRMYRMGPDGNMHEVGVNDPF